MRRFVSKQQIALLAGICISLPKMSKLWSRFLKNLDTLIAKKCRTVSSALPHKKIGERYIVVQANIQGKGGKLDLNIVLAFCFETCYTSAYVR
jgi:hypothetical protein